MGRGITGLLAFALAATACGSEPSGQPTVKEDQALVAMVAWMADEVEPVSDADDAVPVIYLTAMGGGGFAADVQAAVVAATVDDADVRFADALDEVVDLATGEILVDDAAAVVTVGALPEPARSISVTMDRFVPGAPVETVAMQISSTDDGAAVTSASVD